jgi:hypothetical protein
MTTKFKEMGRLIVTSDCGQLAFIDGFCKISGERYSVTVWYNDWRKYAKGVYSAADCFPYLPESDLDIIITGIIERN